MSRQHTTRADDALRTFRGEVHLGRHRPVTYAARGATAGALAGATVAVAAVVWRLMTPPRSVRRAVDDTRYGAQPRAGVT